MNESTKAACTLQEDILPIRGELVCIACDGCARQLASVSWFLQMGEYDLALSAMKRAIPFWNAAMEEMRAIRSAVRMPTT